jgi:carnitine monooxygenase subunit
MTREQPLEARFYTDPEVFERDRERIFHRTWQCVGHVSEVSEPGDYISLPIVDENVFVIRGDDGALRAFYNVCRHRGHPLVEGAGSAKRGLVCPYHAWSYELDGRFRGAPAASADDLAACKGIGLRSVLLEEFCGFVFVNLDDVAAPLTPDLTGLEEQLCSFHPDPAGLRFVCETTIEHDCNWKLSVENYNECYHCPTVHGTSLTRGVLDMAGYSIVPHGQMIWHDGKAQTKNEKQYDYDTTRTPRAGDYAAYWIWPNVSFCCYPGGYFTIRQWLPVSWRKTIYRYRWFSDGSLADEAVEALMVKHRETTGAEDEVVVSKIQKGMESRAFEPGPYIMGDGSGPMSEVGLRHLHMLYRNAMAG